MALSELLDSLNQHFGNEAYPGDDNIIYNNADWECIIIREAFRDYTWQTIPQQLLLDQQWCLPFLSEAGFRYYLPAFMRFAATDFHEADMIPDNIVFNLKLPIAADGLVTALVIGDVKIDKDAPYIDWEFLLKDQLTSMEESIHSFIIQAITFSPGQCRSIYHFLVYMRDLEGTNYTGNEAKIAIQRYWFQFA